MTLLLSCSSNNTPITTDTGTSSTGEIQSLAHGSWASAIENANLLVKLDWDARQLLRVFPTGAGNMISELDLAGSNPSYFDRFGPALWAQCEEVEVHIFIDPSIDVELRAAARNLTLNTILEMNRLTGLSLKVRSGSTEQNEKFFDPSTEPPVPGIRELGVFWYNTVPDAPTEHLGLADVWHTDSKTFERYLSDFSINVTSKKTLNKQSSLLRSRIGLSVEILRSLTNTKITEPSWAMAVMHELAHVVGIGHSTARESFMYPRFNERTHLTAADRATLALAGSKPC